MSSIILVNFNALPSLYLQRKLPRTRSAEEICTTEKESDMDEKGYASDSTVGGHPSSSQEQPPTSSSSLAHKKKKPRDREGHHHHHKPHTRLPSNSGNLLRMKSTGSIFNTPDCTPASALCESRESLLSDGKHRRRRTSSSSYRRPPRLEISGSGHNTTLIGMRRGSVDSGSTMPRSLSKPPLHARRRGSRDDGRLSKDRPIRTRHLSRSLKGESERSPDTIHECALNGMKGSQRSMSCSSVGDYDGSSASPATAASPTSPDGPLVTPPSAGASNKWIVYGFL